MKQKKGSRVKEEKDGSIAKLKQRIRRLEKDKRELISKLNTLEQVLKRNFEVLKGSTEDLSVEELIEGAKKNKTIKQIKDDVEPVVQSDNCPKCNSEEYKIMEIRGGQIGVCGNCTYRTKL